MHICPFFGFVFLKVAHILNGFKKCKIFSLFVLCLFYLRCPWVILHSFAVMQLGWVPSSSTSYWFYWWDATRLNHSLLMKDVCKCNISAAYTRQNSSLNDIVLLFLQVSASIAVPLWHIVLLRIGKKATVFIGISVRNHISIFIIIR